VETSGIWCSKLGQPLQYCSSRRPAKLGDREMAETRAMSSTMECPGNLLGLVNSDDLLLVTKLARRRLESALTVRWPPKGGQPTLTLKRARLSHWLKVSRLRY
jgi:hypothetical protein